MYLNKNWYCLEFDITGSDLGSPTRFWISMTELFVAMNDTVTERHCERHNNRRKWKSMDLSIDMWHSNNMKVMLPNFAKDHCYWTLWTRSYVDCIPFSCIDYLQIVFSNYQKTWLHLQLCIRGPIKSVLFICPSVCPSVFDAFSSRYTVWIFKFFYMRIFSHILKIVFVV